MSETTQPFPPSCGLPLADRRFVFALQLQERGDAEAAIDLILQAEELAPDWPPFAFRRGEMLMAAGRRDEAVAAFTRCLQIDAADRLGAVIKLALLGAVPEPPQLPPGYVAALFDQYAPRFDVKLVERLGYCVPELLASAIADLKPGHETGERVLDLGCGTGLAAERLRRRAAWLEGVDLSAGMLDQARRKGLYDALHRDDLLAALASPWARYDIVLAADVLIYLGALEPVMAAVAPALAADGLFAFSLQKLDGGDYRLGADHRFSHGPAYVAGCAAAAGLSVLRLDEAVIREEGGQPVIGLIVVLGPEALDSPVLASPLSGFTTGTSTPRPVPEPYRRPGSSLSPVPRPEIVGPGGRRQRPRP